MTWRAASPTVSWAAMIVRLVAVLASMALSRVGGRGVGEKGLVPGVHAPGVPPAKEVASAALVHSLSRVASELTVEWPVNGTSTMLAPGMRVASCVASSYGVRRSICPSSTSVRTAGSGGEATGAGDASGQPRQNGIGPPRTAAAGENGLSWARGIALAAAVISRIRWLTPAVRVQANG